MQDDPLQVGIALLVAFILIPLIVGALAAAFGLAEGVWGQVAGAATFFGWAGLAWWRIRSHGIGLRSLLLGSLRWDEAVSRGVLVGLALLGAQSLVGLIIARVAGRWVPNWEEQAQQEQLQHFTQLGSEASPAEWVALFLVIVFVAPVVEELFFRGYVYNALRSRWGVLGAVAASSVIFALLHGVLILFPTILVTGIILAYTYQRSGALLSNIVAHGVLNAIVFYFLVTTYFGAPAA